MNQLSGPLLRPDPATTISLLKKGWFIHLADGRPSTACPTTAPDPTSTPPIRKRPAGIGRLSRQHTQQGLRLSLGRRNRARSAANGSYFPHRTRHRYFNVYPLFHTAALYDGFRRDTQHRALILSRDAYLGAQRNGAMFWSSDIYPTWDTLKRQVPTGLGFTASGWRTGATTSAAGSICRTSIMRRILSCSTPPMRATMSAV